MYRWVWVYLYQAWGGVVAGAGAPAPEVTCTPFNRLLRRRVLTMGGSGFPKISLIREKPTLLFCEVPETSSVWLDSA